MPTKRTPLSNDPWANEIEEVEEVQQNRSQKIKSWAGNALLITVVGSLILVFGQLAGTGISIMFGADDASDFAIIINPNSVAFEIPMIMPSEHKMYVYEKTFTAKATISVEDAHPSLRPYKFNIFLKSLNIPKNINVRISPKEVKAGETANIEINYYHNYSYYANNHYGNYSSPKVFNIYADSLKEDYITNDNMSAYYELMKFANSILKDYIENGNKSALDEYNRYRMDLGGNNEYEFNDEQNDEQNKISKEYNKLNEEYNKLNKQDDLDEEYNEFNEYPIIIEGIGGDGRKRNTTFFVSTKWDGKLIKIIGDKGESVTMELG